MYRIHIEFANGSNPYYSFAMPKKEYDKELKEWKKNYNLELKWTSSLGTYGYYATEKEEYFSKRR